MEKRVLSIIMGFIMAIGIFIIPANGLNLEVNATGTYTTPSGYNENDYQKAVAFLSQTKAIDNWDLEDPETWLAYHTQYVTFDPSTGDNILLGYSNAVIIWNDSNPKRITSFFYNGLDIPDSCLDLSDFTALEWLDCKDNKLSEIDVSGCTSLTYLDCSKNQITELDVSNSATLKYLDFRENTLKNLDVSKNILLEELYCQMNQLTELDVSEHTSLINLTCWENQLISLNVTGCIALEWIDCSKNQIMELDLSSCIALVDLSCWENQITYISFIENLQNLFYIDMSSNNLDLNSATVQTSIANIKEIIEVNSGTFIYEPQNDITDTEIIPVTGIAIVNKDGADVTSLELKVGETVNLYAKIIPSNATNQAIMWYSLSGDKVASIDSNGVVTALNTGTTTLYLQTENGLVDTISVIVKAATTPPPSGGGGSTSDNNTSTVGGSISGGGTSTSDTSNTTKVEKTIQTDGTVITTTTTIASDGTMIKTETATRKGSKNQITIKTTSAKNGKSTTTANVVIKDVKASISTKTGLSTIKTDISLDVSKTKSMLNKRIADIKVVLDDNAILTRINNNKVKNLKIDITGGYNSGVSDIIINKTVIEQARKLGKNIDVYVLDSKGKQIAEFNVNVESKTKVTDLNVSVSIKSISKNAELSKKLNGQKGIVVTLGSANLSSAKKQINLSGFGAKSGQNVYIYKLNSNGELSFTGQMKVSNNGMLIFNSGGIGNYIIVTKKI